MIDHPGPVEVLKYEGVGANRKLIYRGWEDGDEERIVLDNEKFERRRKIAEYDKDDGNIHGKILQELASFVEDDVREAFGDIRLDDLGDYVSVAGDRLEKRSGIVTEIMVNHATKEIVARAAWRVKPSKVESDPITPLT